MAQHAWPVENNTHLRAGNSARNQDICSYEFMHNLEWSPGQHCTCIMQYKVINNVCCNVLYLFKYF